MIIAVTGLAGSGKDSVAKYIEKRTGTFYRTKFVQPAINWIIETYQLANEQEYDQFKRSTFVSTDGMTISGRVTVREVGMLMRKHNPSFGTDWILQQEQKHTNVVISDLRFQNELDFLRQKTDPVIVIQVKRSTQQESSTNSQHISEKGFAPHQVDYVIENDGSLEDLYRKTEEILNETYFEKQNKDH